MPGAWLLSRRCASPLSLLFLGGGLRDTEPGQGSRGARPCGPPLTPPSLRRLVELSPAAAIGAHWGVLSKCLAYGKAASDPFVYSLLRRQYRKSCREMLNRLLNRRSFHPSGLTGHARSQNILPAAE